MASINIKNFGTSRILHRVNGLVILSNQEMTKHSNGPNHSVLSQLLNVNERSRWSGKTEGYQRATAVDRARFLVVNVLSCWRGQEKKSTFV